MTAEEFIIAGFVAVDDPMSDMSKHALVKLYPSKLVTMGNLFALKGVYLRAF